ncbi:MAG: hypothetical protein FD167_5224, partial [bacterium]
VWEDSGSNDKGVVYINIRFEK